MSDNVSVPYKEPEYPNDNWTRIEIFRLVYGHLPSHTSDTITKKTLQQFTNGVFTGKIKSQTIDVIDVAGRILRGDVLTSAAMKRRNAEFYK